MNWPADMPRPDYIIRYDCADAMGGALNVQASLVDEGKTSHLLMDSAYNLAPTLDPTLPAGEARHVQQARELDGITNAASLIIVGCVEHADQVHGRFLTEGPADSEPTRMVVESPDRRVHDGGAWVTQAVIKVLHENTGVLGTAPEVVS